MFWRPKNVEPVDVPSEVASDEHPYRPLAVITPIEAPPLTPMPTNNFNNQLLSSFELQNKKRAAKATKVSKLRLAYSYHQAKSVIRDKVLEEGKTHGTFYVDIWCSSNIDKAAIIAKYVAERLRKDGMAAKVRGTDIDWRLKTDNDAENHEG